MTPAQNLVEPEYSLQKSSWLRKLTAAVLSLGAAASFMVLSSAPASAATCYGYTCEGADPNNAGCSADAYTVAAGSFTSPSGRYIELRYSPRCGAAWTRWGVGYTTTTHMTIYSNSKTTGVNLNLESGQGAGMSGWTLMVPAADKNVRICAEENRYYSNFWQYCGSTVGFGGNGTPQPQSVKDSV